MKYPLASVSWDTKEFEAMQSVINSGEFTMGKKVIEFENNFAKYFGSKYACMVNSGSSANLIAIATLFYRKNNPLKRGDEVIVPAVSWSTTYYPLQQYGLHCKFVDIDIDTLNYDLDSLEKAVSDSTKAIVVVNLLGNPNDFNKIKSIIGNRKIDIIEDNCESMGAEYDNKKTGTLSLIGTFSSFFSHHISTMEGGIIVTDNEELYQIMLCLRAHGWTRNLPDENMVSGTKSSNPFYESFNFILPGYNVRPGEIHAALGIEQLKKLDSFIKIRRKNAKIFLNEFQNHPFIKFQKEISNSSWFGFSMIVSKNSTKKRDDLINFLTSNGVECRPIVSGNFLKNPVLKYFDYSVHGKIVNASEIDDYGFFIGNHQYDLETEIKELKKLVNLFFEL
ncbi:MAG: DegT/DnrJ/EryC1/StrS family aminotransferase [Flavobacteriia bacterium]|nr:DegT/DnrJ/EryC1/StrS family aminotransferase [Flavobacteriia bacterium]